MSIHIANKRTNRDSKGLMGTNRERNNEIFYISPRKSPDFIGRISGNSSLVLETV